MIISKNFYKLLVIFFIFCIGIFVISQNQKEINELNNQLLAKEGNIIELDQINKEHQKLILAKEGNIIDLQNKITELDQINKEHQKLILAKEGNIIELDQINKGHQKLNRELEEDNKNLARKVNNFITETIKESSATKVAPDKKHCTGFAKWEKDEFVQVRESKCVTEKEYQAYLNAPEYLCKYYQKSIWKESEREYGKKQYRYTEEKLKKIKSLKDEGKALCDAGKLKEGEAKLEEAIKIISFTRMN